MSLKKRARIFLKECVAFSLVFLRPRHSHRGSILMYHSFGHNNKFSTVTPANFERQLQYLRRSSLRVIRLREMIERICARDDLRGYIALTVDDGYEDFYKNGFPLLKKYEVPATLFVVSGKVGGEMQTKQGQVFNIVSEDQMREMAHSGLVDVMSHTATHPRLTECSQDDGITEIEQGRVAVEKITGTVADLFAYPFGAYTMEIASYIRDHNHWKGAVAVEPGLVGHTSDVACLPRNSIDSEVGMWQFRMKTSDAITTYLSIKR